MAEKQSAPMISLPGKMFWEKDLIKTGLHDCQSEDPLILGFVGGLLGFGRFI